MTINKAAYEAILAKAIESETTLNLLETSIEATGELAYQPVFDGFSIELDSIKIWAQSYIEQANQEEQNAVMNNFLMELKVVFDKYAASISTASFEDGYGTSYGEPGIGFILTATLDNVTSTKDIRKAVINSEDLV